MQTVPLTESPVAGSVSDEYFYRMLSPYALELSAPFNKEEALQLEQSLRNCATDMNFVAVGGGELWELRRALRYTKHYTCIEPLADVFINDSVRYLTERAGNITILPKLFGEVARHELPDGSAFFMFLFNILAYIDNPIETLNAITRPGDVLFISTWADTPKAKDVRKTYFDYLNNFEDAVVVDPEQTTGLAHLDSFPVERLNSFKKMERFKGQITDILVIYT